MKPIIDYLTRVATSKLEHIERWRGRAGVAADAARGLAAPALPDSLRAKLLEIPRRTMSDQWCGCITPPRPGRPNVSPRMEIHRMHSAGRQWARGTALGTGVALIALVATTNCGGSDGPTAPSGSAIALTDASVVVNGQIINGQTLPRGHGQGGSTRFEASFMLDGRPAPGQVVQVRFDRPGSGMMNTTGMFLLYDDGTHGDRMPGDGIYCYEDTAGQYGCHTEDARPGQYHYDFSGMHEGVHESNHMLVTVTINP